MIVATRLPFEHIHSPRNDSIGPQHTLETIAPPLGTFPKRHLHLRSVRQVVGVSGHMTIVNVRFIIIHHNGTLFHVRIELLQEPPGLTSRGKLRRHDCRHESSRVGRPLEVGLCHPSPQLGQGQRFRLQFQLLHEELVQHGCSGRLVRLMALNEQRDNKVHKVLVHVLLGRVVLPWEHGLPGFPVARTRRCRNVLLI